MGVLNEKRCKEPYTFEEANLTLNNANGFIWLNTVPGQNFLTLM